MKEKGEYKDAEGMRPHPLEVLVGQGPTACHGAKQAGQRQHPSARGFCKPLVMSGPPGWLAGCWKWWQLRFNPTWRHRNFCHALKAPESVFTAVFIPGMCGQTHWGNYFMRLLVVSFLILLSELICLSPARFLRT